MDAQERLRSVRRRYENLETGFGRDALRLSDVEEELAQAEMAAEDHVEAS